MREAVGHTVQAADRGAAIHAARGRADRTHHRDDHMRSRARACCTSALILLAGCHGLVRSSVQPVPRAEVVRPPSGHARAVVLAPDGAAGRLDTLGEAKLERDSVAERQDLGKATRRASTIALIVVVVLGLVFLLASPSPG